MICTLRILLIPFLIIILLSSYSYSFTPINNLIKDINLCEAISAELHKPVNNIMIQDLQNLETLNAQSMGIKQLDGIQYCVALKELDLNNNYINDVKALNQCVNLKKLDLSYNSIESIASFTQLKNLCILNISCNSLVSLSLPIDCMPSLKMLSAFKNNICEFPDLGSFPQLIVLYLDCNSISDISNVTTLGQLKILGLSDNLITDIFPFSKIGETSNEIQIELSYNPVTNNITEEQINNLLKNQIRLDLFPNYVDYMSIDINLNEIDLIKPKVVNIPANLCLNNVKVLHINGIYIDNVKSASDLESLYLEYYGNKPLNLNLDIFKRFPKLKHLEIYSEGITEINCNEDNCRFELLLLDCNKLTNLDFAVHLKMLKQLSLDVEYIQDLSSLNQIPNVFILHINNLHNCYNYGFITKLYNLQYLTISNSALFDLKFLQELKLKSIELPLNNIQIIKPLLRNDYLNCETLINLYDNPLNELSLYEDIPALEARGVTVYYDKPADYDPSKVVKPTSDETKDEK